MGAILSPARKNWPVLNGLKLINRGKVRDTYELPDGNLLMVATDAVSIFDFVLNALIPMKGVILTILNIFFSRLLTEELGVKTHLFAAGAEIDKHLPECLRGNSELQSRAIVVTRLNMIPVEFIARYCLAGSAKKPYAENRTVCGRVLPNGLQPGDVIPNGPLFTPTTKAEVGHDEHMDAADVAAAHPRCTLQFMEIFQFMVDFCRQRGILLPDTKCEFGLLPHSNVIVLADESFTPDSSRFWEYREWAETHDPPVAARKEPTPFDKQLVRNWGIGLGINKKQVGIDEPWVHEHVVPRELIARTTQIYRYICWRLTGKRYDYHLQKIGIAVRVPKKKIRVMLASDSDLLEVLRLLRFWDRNGLFEKVIVDPSISCHRHPDKLQTMAQDGCGGVDAVIYAGGKAFAAAGVLESWLHHFGHDDIPVIGVALGEEGSKSQLAAELSIEELPGQPVVLNELNGNRPYAGESGLNLAFERLACGELPPPRGKRKEEEAIIGKMIFELMK